MTLKRLFFVTSVLFSATLMAQDESDHYHDVVFNGFHKSYPIVPVKKGSDTGVVYINFRDDNGIVKAAAKELARRMPQDIDYLVILGDKANGLGVLTAVAANKPWEILAAKETPIPTKRSIEYGSITSGRKNLYLNIEQAERLKGKKIALLDDVISTGGTMNAAVDLLLQSSVSISSIMCVCTEGDEREVFEWTSTASFPLIKLAHLPVVTLS